MNIKQSQGQSVSFAELTSADVARFKPLGARLFIGCSTSSTIIFRSIMRTHWTHRIAAIGAVLAFPALTIVAAHAQAEVIRPIKVATPEIDGSIFQRKDAVHETKNGNVTTDVVTFTSKDAGFQTGLYQSGPLNEVDKDYPYNEFLYFISGGATLISTDGSVVTVHAGEAVTIPKGWSGTFNTNGYIKLYVTYNPDDVKK